MFSLAFSVLGNAGFIGVLAVFIWQWSEGETLDTAKTFPLMVVICYMFFMLHRNTVTSYLNNNLSKQLVGRYDSVLGLEERKKQDIEMAEEGQNIVEITDASYSWGFTLQHDLAQLKSVESKEEVLTNIKFNMKRHDMLTVVGKSGSGKTTLLYSILGETEKIKGD